MRKISHTKKNAGEGAVSFNYDPIPEELGKQLQADAREIRTSLMKAAISFMEVGKRLANCRSKLPHGAWIPWLQTETGLSEQSARDAINVYLRFREEPLFLEELGLALPQTALVRLATAPDPAFEDVRQCLVNGQQLRVSDVSEIITRHRRSTNLETDGSVAQKKVNSSGKSAIDDLRSMANQAREELLTLVVERLEEFLNLIEDAQAKKPSKKSLETQMRVRAQWLTDALEQLTQKRAVSDAKLIHVTLLDRQHHAPGPWADVTSFFREIAHSLAWEAIKSSDIPALLQRGRTALLAILAREA